MTSRVSHVSKDSSQEHIHSNAYKFNSFALYTGTLVIKLFKSSINKVVLSQNAYCNTIGQPFYKIRYPHDMPIFKTEAQPVSNVQLVKRLLLC